MRTERELTLFVFRLALYVPLSSVHENIGSPGTNRFFFFLSDNLYRTQHSLGLSPWEEDSPTNPQLDN